MRVDGPRSRIARLMALGEGDDSDEGRGTAFLPPMLAHNLGLRLHLDALSSCDGSAAAVTFVRIHRHPIAIPRLETPSGAVGIRVPGAITHLPIAGTVHIAELRLPSSSFIDLFTRPPESADGKGTSDGSTSAVIPGPETQKASEDEDNVVKAVEAYFTSGRRVVNAGDALAIVVPTGHGASADYLSGGVDTSKELLHLIITSIAPGAGPCIFVPGRTSAILQGRASGAIPACVEAFLGLRKPREGPLDSGIIMPEIPGLRELLPHWRQLAGLLAPALHPLSINLPLRCARALCRAAHS